MDFNGILKELRNNEIRGVYVLEGEDDYLKSKIVSALEKVLIEPSTRDLDRVVIGNDIKSKSEIITRIGNEISTPPFLSRRRLVIVKKSGLFSSSVSGDELIGMASEVLGSITDSVSLVFLEEKIDKRKKALLKIVREKGIDAKIDKPDLNALRKWVYHEFSSNKIRISVKAADMFIERNDRDLYSMENEAVKLVLYCKNTEITELLPEHITKMGITDLKESIFDLFDHISSGNAQKALEIFDSLLSQREAVQLILFMLARHIRQLICAKDLGSQNRISSVLKVPPFVSAKLSRQCAGTDIEKLENMYLKCHDYDLMIKTSKINDRTALEILIVEFSASLKAS